MTTFDIFIRFAVLVIMILWCVSGINGMRKAKPNPDEHETPIEGAHGTYDPRPTSYRPVYVRVVLAKSRSAKADRYWRRVNAEIQTMTKPFRVWEG